MTASLVFILAALILLWDLDALNVTIMEARNFVTAREMVTEGNYLLPTLNGDYRLQKPPLPTWMTALSGRFTAMQSLFWLRLPAVCLGLLALLLTMQIERVLSRSRKGMALAGLLLLTSFYFFWTARSGMWDIFAQGFALLAIVAYIKATRSQTFSVGLALAFGIGLGASFMSKGPVALYGLFLPFLLAYHLFYFKRGQWRRSMTYFVLIGLVLAIIFGSWWPIFVNNSEAAYEAKRIILNETQNWKDYNVRPFYYYWSFPTQTGVWTVFGFFAIVGYVLFYKRFANNPKLRFYFWWTCGVIIFLSIIPEKKSRYLLPVLFPLALFTAAMVREAHFNAGREWMKWAGWITGVVIGLAGIVLLVPFSYEYLSGWTWRIGGIIALIGGFASVYFLTKRGLLNAIYTIAFTVILMIPTVLNGIGETLNSKNAINSFNRFSKEPTLLNRPTFSTLEFRPEQIWEIGRRVPILWACELPKSLDTIGVFTYYGVEIELGDELDGFRIIDEELFDQNPKESTKKPNIALWRYYAVLVKEK